MDVSEMISDLGDHGFTDSSTDTKVRMLQDAIWDIEGRRDWPFLEASLNLTFDGSDEVPTNWPADFKSVLVLKDKIVGGLLEPIDLTTLEELTGTNPGLKGAPRFYYTEGGVVRLWPAAPATYSVRLRYLRFSAEITSSTMESAILIPARHHRAIVLGALVRLYDMEDDPELAARFETHYEARIERMVNDIYRWQYDRSEYVEVTDPDSWDY